METTTTDCEATMAGKRKAGDRDTIDGVTITRGSGNVFADLGFDDAEERVAKASLAHEIAERCDGMTQKEIAARLEIDQPKVSALLRGQLQQFSTERLMTFVRRVGQDVEIHVHPSRHGRSPRKPAVLGRLLVVAHA
jgi:predicted XRE-type DNA-binding protein